MKSRIVELATQLGILFVVAVLVIYFWNLIARGTPTIDWRTASLTALVLEFFLSIGGVLKRRSNNP